jgi:hypothetical protein
MSKNRRNNKMYAQMSTGKLKFNTQESVPPAPKALAPKPVTPKPKKETLMACNDTTLTDIAVITTEETSSCKDRITSTVMAHRKSIIIGAVVLALGHYIGKHVVMPWWHNRKTVSAADNV